MCTSSSKKTNNALHIPATSSGMHIVYSVTCVIGKQTVLPGLVLGLGRLCSWWLSVQVHIITRNIVTSIELLACKFIQIHTQCFPQVAPVHRTAKLCVAVLPSSVTQESTPDGWTHGEEIVSEVAGSGCLSDYHLLHHDQTGLKGLLLF